MQPITHQILLNVEISYQTYKFTDIRDHNDNIYVKATVFKIFRKKLCILSRFYIHKNN